MSNTRIPESPSAPESNESFGESSFPVRAEPFAQGEEGGKGLEGTVIAVSGESVFVDIGFKTEGILPLAAFPERRRNGQTRAISCRSRSRAAIRKRLLRAFARQGRAAQGLVVAGEGLRRQDAHRGHGDRRGQRRTERGCGSARVHAGLAQRSARRRRDGKAGGAGDPLPHHQARRDR